ncbi:SDR family oxidoreductase [Nafulsella turpanensis]|uniref:SDR family oxidoreductase n=1 Tax=Nafulsella turpanensis TaxID=1265690 RepID=UPI0003480B58|nr:NAD(P)H-binding protein [Nafulsella turpanensis]
MEKVLIAGASGALGIEVLKKLHHLGIPARALVHSEQGFEKVEPYTHDIFFADARDPHAMEGVCKDMQVVFSALGKSVSLFKPRLNSYREIDYEGNRNLLHQALRSGVKRFVYTSIMGSGSAHHLSIAKEHQRIQHLLEQSPVQYTIIKPVGFFSGLHDLLIMAKRGIIPIPGSGHFRTNSIHPTDLAQVAVDHLFEGPKVMDVGGPKIESRNEMARTIQAKTNARIIHISPRLMQAGLVPFGLFKKGFAANLDYFRYVTTHDMIAPCYGKITFKEYVEQLDLNQLP